MRPLLLVLTVIRNSETRSLVRMVLEGAGHRVIESDAYPQAQSLLSNGLDPDMLLVESVAAGPGETVEFRQLLKNSRKHNVCLILGVGEQAQLKEASQLGIDNFLMKPVTRADVESTIDKMSLSCAHGPNGEIVFPSSASSAQTPSVPSDMPEVLHLEELGDDLFFLAASPKMLHIHRQVKLLADVDVNVLILGESGTGKEVIARLLHKHSRRSERKFMNVNCAALPADLLESELFGHQQGAFTGATKDKPGKFEQANRGTLLLDEIGEISPQMQAKLLHVLQDGRFTRLGGEESTKVDVRVIAATNIQMEKALREKTFREDLYYRLSAFIINVPPLRERREEIPYLIEETIRRMPAEMKSGAKCTFSSALMEAVLPYDWPGNLRELRNFVTRTIVLRDQEGALRELETKISARNGFNFGTQPSEDARPRSSGMRSIVRDVRDRTEAQMIMEALHVSGWNRRHAAQDLNISYRALLYKIQQYNLSPRMPRGIDEGSRNDSSALGRAV